jgi:hypothetical protein
MVVDCSALSGQLQAWQLLHPYGTAALIATAAAAASSADGGAAATDAADRLFAGGCSFTSLSSQDDVCRAMLLTALAKGTLVLNNIDQVGA